MMFFYCFSIHDDVQERPPVADFTSSPIKLYIDLFFFRDLSVEYVGKYVCWTPRII